MDINTSAYTGNVTKDIKAHKSRDGKHVYANFYIGSDYFSKGKQHAVFIPCVLFGKPAQIAAKYIHKGDKLAVSGYTRPDDIKTKHGDIVHSRNLVLTNFQWSSKHSSGIKDITISKDDIPF